MPNRLQRYRDMRDFSKTAEPQGQDAQPSGERPMFVVQEHHATALHWDFRLQHDGVLVSWALPKGVPVDPKSNHLAVQTEDHPLDYAAFQGDIPTDSYGAGKVSLWDRGWYEEHKFRDGEVMVTLHGERVDGKYVLFRTDGKQWMIHRMDPAQDPTREPVPVGIAPMLAKLAHALPVGEGWSFEVKWDGVRCLAYVSGGRIRLESRNRLDISAQYPELRELGESLGSLEVVLDGEIVAFNAEGRPSFERLQQRLGLKGEAARRRSREIPAIYIVFDLLFLDGHPTTTLPFRDRRALLEQLNLQGAAWRTATVHDDGESLLAATKEHGLEGVIAKRLDSSYEEGRRTGAWLKVKNHLHQPFIVCGWMQRDNATMDTIGALVLGYYDDEKQLHYAGRVGTGFTEESAARLMSQLQPLRRPSSPFASPIPERPSAFTEPRVVVDVEFLEWTEEGMLRQPSFKGVRADCAPGDVVRESD